MKRGKKIIVNVCLILLLLIGVAYVEGLYVSKEKCELEFLEANYRVEKEKILEFQVGESSYSVYGGDEKQDFRVVQTKQVGFLYKNVGQPYVVGKSFEGQFVDVSSWSDYISEENDCTFLFYRVDPKLSKLVLEFEDGKEVTVDEWNQEFATYYVEQNSEEGMPLTCTIYCYDEAGKLIDEIDRTY